MVSPPQNTKFARSTLNITRYGKNSVKKNMPAALTLSLSNFPATPLIPTALEIESASSSPTHDTWRAYQEAPLGTALAANRCCRKNWNFIHVGQQLGTWYHFPIAQDDEENSGISRLYSKINSQGSQKD